MTTPNRQELAREMRRAQLTYAAAMDAYFLAVYRDLLAQGMPPHEITKDEMYEAMRTEAKGGLDKRDIISFLADPNLIEGRFQQWGAAMLEAFNKAPIPPKAPLFD